MEDYENINLEHYTEMEIELASWNDTKNLCSDILPSELSVAIPDDIRARFIKQDALFQESTDFMDNVQRFIAINELIKSHQPEKTRNRLKMEELRAHYGVNAEI